MQSWAFSCHTLITWIQLLLWRVPITTTCPHNSSEYAVGSKRVYPKKVIEKAAIPTIKKTQKNNLAWPSDRIPFLLLLEMSRSSLMSCLPVSTGRSKCAVGIQKSVVWWYCCLVDYITPWSGKAGFPLMWHKGPSFSGLISWHFPLSLPLFDGLWSSQMKLAVLALCVEVLSFPLILANGYCSLDMKSPPGSLPWLLKPRSHAPAHFHSTLCLFLGGTHID